MLQSVNSSLILQVVMNNEMVVKAISQCLIEWLEKQNR